MTEDWRDGRCVVIRPDVPGHLDVDTLQLVRSDEERAAICAAISAAVDTGAAQADSWPRWLAEVPDGN